MKKNLVLALLLFFAVTHAAEKEQPRYWPLQIGDMFFSRIELAITEAEQTKGLMGRKTLAEEQGMLFVKQQPEIMLFWMKNTLVPLDIIFLGQDGRIIKIWQMPVEPPQRADESLADYHRRLPTYSSEKPASFALELKGGVSEILQLKAGHRIDIDEKALRELLSKSQK